MAVDLSAWRPGETLTLKPGRTKWGLMGLGSAAFVAAGLVFPDMPAQWFVVVFFGLCALAALVMFMGGSTLTIEPDRIEVRHAGRLTEHRFDRVSPFVVWSGGASGRYVTFEDLDRRESHPRATKLNHALGAGSASLPDSYGLKPEQLASLLNAARDHWLALHRGGVWTFPHQ